MPVVRMSFHAGSESSGAFSLCRAWYTRHGGVSRVQAIPRNVFRDIRYTDDYQANSSVALKGERIVVQIFYEV